MSHKIHLVIVTQNRLFRECLASALVAADRRFDVSFADNPDSALNQSETIPIDMLILDLCPPNRCTIDHTRKIARRFQASPILVVGQPKTEIEIVSYLESGAADYRTTLDETVGDLCDAIWRILRGEVTYSPERARALFARLQELARRKASLKGLDSCRLTRRELQVLGLVDQGKSNQDIATDLHISLHTVKNHVHRILEKLNVKNRREAVHYAYSQGWLKLSA